MYFEKQFNELIEKQKVIFSNLFNEYLSAQTDNEALKTDGRNNRKAIEEKLNIELKRITRPKFVARLNDYINKYKEGNVGNFFSFERFCYFINKLTTEKISTKLVMYNPHICDAILSVIALEYVQILNFLQQNIQSERRLNTKTQRAYREQFIRVWFKLACTDIFDVVDNEYEKVLQELNKLV